ncbi:MAG: amidohydrolase family protein [Chloroflexi bacterium]|nr:amidohydrolase family protein [Chloroflexota bacterium]
MTESDGAMGGRATLLLEHGTILTMDAARTVIEDGAIAINGQIIAEVGPAGTVGARYEADRTIDLAGGVVQPGFIDAHVHLSHQLGRGTVPDHWPESREHDQWLPYWLSMTREDAYLSALLSCLEMLHNGTTTFSDMSGRHEAELRERAAREVGLRGAVTEICWDIPPHQAVAIGGTEACVAVLEDLVARLPRTPGELVWGGITLSGMGKASDELLTAAHAMARRLGLPMSMHQSFGVEDVEAYRAQTGTSAVEHLARLGILGPDLTLVHMIHCEERELELLVETGTNVVHCPAASTKAAMGVSHVGRIPEMVAAGVAVALGSDSGNYSDYLDVGRQAYLAATIHREARGARPVISGEQALEMATIHGARAMGLSTEIGSLEPGKQADLVVHSTRRPEWHPLLDVVSQLIYSAQSTSVDLSIVGGRVVLEEGRSTLVDESEVLRRIDQAGRDLYERMGWPGFSRWPVVR